MYASKSTTYYGKYGWRNQILHNVKYYIYFSLTVSVVRTTVCAVQLPGHLKISITARSIKKLTVWVATPQKNQISKQ